MQALLTLTVTFAQFKLFGLIGMPRSCIDYCCRRHKTDGSRSKLTFNKTKKKSIKVSKGLNESYSTNVSTSQYIRVIIYFTHEKKKQHFKRYAAGSKVNCLKYR